MKLFKKLAVACLALTFCCGLVAFAACGGDKGGNNSSADSSYNHDSPIIISSNDSSSDVEDSAESVSSNNSSEVKDSADNLSSDSSVPSDDSVSSDSSVPSDDSVSSDSSEEEGNTVVAKANAYNFIIKNADGSAAVGYAVQMCTTDGSGICYAPSNAIGNVSDENGFVYVEMGSMSCPNPAVYEVHVMLNGVQVELSSVVNTPAAASLDLIILTLA